MRLINRKKLNFWAAVASIVGLYWAAQPMTASSQSQPRTSVSTTGNQSPAIGSNSGNVYNNYYNAPNTGVKGEGYVLKRSTPLVDSPDLAKVIQDAAKHVVCSAPAGTPVELTGQRANLDRWWEVTALKGPCEGQRGWIAIESLGME